MKRHLDYGNHPTSHITEPQLRSAEDGSSDVVLMSRQPIYTRTGQLLAYQLLYQRDVAEHGFKAHSPKVSGNPSPHPFLVVELESLVGDSLGFVDIPRTFILEDYCRAFPKEKIVLEISSSVDVDEAVIRAVTAFKEAGYTLALRNFDYFNQNIPLIELASYVSMDFSRLSRDEIFAQFSTLARHKAKVIARNLETHNEFESAKVMGFEYFSGPCFNKPKVSAPMRVPINRLSTLQLVLKLQDSELRAQELERIVSQDLAISYKLLRYINSAALSLPRNIESIKHAIQMIGTARIREWAGQFLLAKLDDKPAELLVTALVRGRMCEAIAAASGASKPDSYYMVGLFSVVDALLNVNMPDAIQLLPFSTPIRQALLSHEGQMGSVLRCVLDYENGNWEGVGRCGLAAGTIRQCYLDAIADARKMPKS